MRRATLLATAFLGAVTVALGQAPPTPSFEWRKDTITKTVNGQPQQVQFTHPRFTDVGGGDSTLDSAQGSLKGLNANTQKVTKATFRLYKSLGPGVWPSTPDINDQKASFNLDCGRG